ncbi:small GTPase [Dictyostelium discoideum AX4]|uniref:Small GTPase n=1 Tax=Dictyostelium discoideum TaxID=44689 RepID=Q54DD9_DICDI|nr:small GTPase [Dictyostelium discoideum AX4]EAL61283.1 small GTPase [Dictyostelium discoideum AX4]|eukprot:XP_629702.1 small GTPase [Dictyostelium discoideum AX4]
MGKIINLCVLGASYTGKTCVINTFLNSYFDEEYYPTIENKSSKIFLYDKILYNLNIYDTAGLNEFNNLQLISDSIKKCDGFIIVYSLNNRESIDKIDYYKDIIKQFKFKDCPTILVANKMDLVDEIVISKTESSDLSSYYKCPMVESSCKNLNSIVSVFNLILEEINKSYLEIEKQEVQNRKLLLKKTKTEYHLQPSLKKTKSEFCLQKKKTFVSFFKNTFKDIVSK